jgi:hypothetical protein
MCPAAHLLAQSDSLVIPAHPLLAGPPVATPATEVGGRNTPTQLPVTIDDDQPEPATKHPLVQKFETEPAQAQQPLPSAPVAQRDPQLSPLVDPYYSEAELAEPADGDVHVRYQFTKKLLSVQYLTGVMFTPYHFGIPIGQQIPMTFLMENVRLCYCVRGNGADRWLRGSSEIIFEFHTMPILNGPGSIVVGAAVFGRYNFSFNDRKRVMFYFQSGGGGMFCNSYLYPPTSLVSGFNFIIHFGGGMKIFLSRSLSLDLESAYYHYSNGGMVMPNISVNGANEFIGFTYYFGKH